MSSSSSSSSFSKSSSSPLKAVLDAIASPLGGWSCDYLYFMTIFTFFFGIIIIASMMMIKTPSKIGLAAGVIPVTISFALAYFNARILYSTCAASIGRRRR